MFEEIYEKLSSKGLLINPDKIEDYLKNFEGAKETPINKNFWAEKRVLITGINGFAGSNLAEQLVINGAKVYGLVRRHSVPDYSNINHLTNNVTLIEGNLDDANSINSAFKMAEPTVVFHLGAQSFVPTSFRCPIETFQTNIIGTSNVLEAVRNSKNIEAVHIAGSSEEYGSISPEELPANEKTLLRPQSPYGVSKAAADIMSQNYCKAYGVPSVITRAFNHTGTRRGLQFVTSVVARQVAKVSSGISNKIIIGNPHPIRDFSDVRDIVRGYMLAVEKGKRGEPYNLGHGFGISIKDLIKLSADVVGVKDFNIEIDKERFRPAEVDILLCDYSKATEDFGYKPTIPLTKTLYDNIMRFKSNPQLLHIERH